MFAKAQKILYSLDNFQFAVYDSNLVYTRISLIIHTTPERTYSLLSCK